MASSHRSASAIRYSIGALLCLGLGVAASLILDIDFQVESRLTGSRGYSPAFQRRGGTQLVMVFVGASTCGASNHPGLPSAVEAMKAHVWRLGRDGGHTVKVEGVALDWSPERGIDYLKRFGAFDELTAGYSWGNNWALSQIWSNSEIDPSTPQVLIFLRHFTTPQVDGSSLHYASGEKRLVFKATGTDEILAWEDSEQLPRRPEDLGDGSSLTAGGQAAAR